MKFIGNTLDGEGTLLLSKNRYAVYAEQNSVHLVIQNWKIYCTGSFRAKLEATWAALRFIWGRS